MAQRRLNALHFLWAVSNKSLVIPPGGWHAHSFAVHGAAMVKATHRAAQITQRRAIPVVARAAVKIFDRQLEKVISIMERHHGRRSVKVGFELNPPSFVDVAFPNDGALWLEALQEVFSETGNAALTAELMPPIQSVMAQGYSKTNLLLGQEAAADVKAMVARRSQAIAQKITKINETTRKEFVRVISESVDSGATVYETVKALRAELPQINASRQLTIARTELSNAWTQGSATAYKESDTLAAVSVIGCQDREGPPSPQWKGESTCNYEDLPVTDLDAFLDVGFHPNHTGVLTPSRFKNADGSSDSI